MQCCNPSRIIAAAVLLAVLGGVLSAGQTSARAGQPTEYQVKAAYLLNFTKFIEWPASAFRNSDTPFSICIAGNDPFGEVIDHVVEGETVGGRKISIRRLADKPPTSCHVVYGGKALPGPAPSGVLTVGEGEGFTRRGGIIGFVVEDRRVRFEINQRVAHRAGLVLSSKLLTVARKVEK